MSQKRTKPTQPTLFAKMLGVKKLGIFDSEEGVYTLELSSVDSQAKNFFNTLHGGALLGLLDDACGMAIYHRYGVNSAVTIKIDLVEFLQPIRTSSSLTIVCSIINERDEKIFIGAQAWSNNKLIARMNAIWEKRC